MAPGTPRRHLSPDTLLEMVGGALGLVAVALAIVVLGFTAAEVDGLGLSPNAVSTVVSLVLLLGVSRAIDRFVPRPA